MSALGHKQTFAVQKGMSTLPPIANICSAIADVRFVPKAEIQTTGKAFQRTVSSRRVTHRFNVVPIRIEYERSVVTRMVVRGQTGSGPKSNFARFGPIADNRFDGAGHHSD